MTLPQSWECGILLAVGKGMNVIIKQGNPVVSEVLACHFMFIMCSGNLGDHITKKCSFVLSFSIRYLLSQLPSLGSLV